MLVAETRDKPFSLTKNIINVLWRDYFNFSGVTTRLEYWSYILFKVLLVSALCLPFVFLDKSVPVALTEMPSFYILFVFLTCSAIPELALICRHLRDAGYSGWLSMIVFVLDIIVVPVIGLFPSKIYGNPYRASRNDGKERAEETEEVVRPAQF